MSQPNTFELSILSPSDGGVLAVAQVQDRESADRMIARGARLDREWFDETQEARRAEASESLRQLRVEQFARINALRAAEGRPPMTMRV